MSGQTNQLMGRCLVEQILALFYDVYDSQNNFGTQNLPFIALLTKALHNHSFIKSGSKLLQIEIGRGDLFDAFRLAWPKN